MIFRPHPPFVLRKPDWLKVRLPGGREFHQVKGVLSGLRLHSICREALCPNMAECFHAGTATFLILGDTCTRNCGYCHVKHGTPRPPSPDEPERLTEAVRSLGLQYVVITSVTRDDLEDGGAAHFAACIDELHRQVPGCRVECLIPDFQGRLAALEKVMAAGPDVINHNMECASSLFPDLRPQGDYGRSLELLRRVHLHGDGKIATKSGFMVGFGETDADILQLLEDLAAASCQRLTIGQYQQPTRNHWPVMKYYHPDEFTAFRDSARAMGFRHVEAGPLVRSSYHAAATGNDRIF